MPRTSAVTISEKVATTENGDNFRLVTRDGEEHSRPSTKLSFRNALKGLALASLTATIPAQAIAQAACSVADMVEFPSVYYEDFGTGSGRTMNNDVLNHTFQPTGGIQDDWYAVGRSADLSGAYMQTLGGVDADGETEGRYLGINMRGKNEPGNSWQGEFYRQNNISMVPSGLPSGASLGGFRFSTALVGTCAGCEDVPNFTLIIEDSSNGSQLASDTSSGIGVANDDVWRTATLDVVPAPASATAANLVLFNSQPEGDNGNDVGVDNISFVPLVCYSPVLDFTKTEVLITNVVGDPDAVEAGDVIRYTFTAVNSGSATAYNVAVTENSFNGLGAIPVPVVFSGAADLDGGNGTNTDVAVGATLVYRADYVITQGDIDAGGIINNLADIAYEDLAGNPFSDTSDDDDVTSGDQPTSTPVPVPAVDDASSGNAQGDTVNITLTNNDGVAAIDSTVSLIPPSGAIGVVTDGNGDIISFTVPNQGAWSYTDGSGILQFVPLAGFAGNPTPIGYTVKAPNGANSNSASVTISYVPSVPEIELVKSVSSVADTSGNGIFGDAGDTVNYTFTAENTGNTALAGITVSDTDLAALSGAFTLNQPAAGFDGDLAAGEGPVTVATATYVLHVSDVAARGVTNSADVTSTAVATSAGGDPVPGAPLLGFGPIVDDSDAGSEASFDTQDGSTTPISNPAGTGGPDDPTVLNISNVVALDDSGTATSGTSSTPVANVTTEGTPDTVNGVAATLGSGGNATVAENGTWPTGFSLNTTTGAVIYDGTSVPPGDYTMDYDLCDLASTPNCATATVTVTVAADIVPVDDSGTATSGTSSTPVANVTTEGTPDTVNGVAATLGSGGNATVAENGTWPTGFSLNTTTGAVIYDGTSVPPGDYTMDYDLCDLASPTPNCETATVTVTVAADIVPVDDSGTATSGTSSTPVANVTTEGTPDTVNGVAATLGSGGNATVAENGTWPTGFSLNTTTGAVIYDGTSVLPGDYTMDYDLCDLASPTPNCETATVTVTVAATPIEAVDDTPPNVDGATGASIPNVVANDSLNGVTNPSIGSDVIINESGTAQDSTALGLDVTPAAGGIDLDPNTGIVTVAAGTTAGTYVYTYELCEAFNPANCDTATVTLVVDPLNLITRIESDLEVILEEDLANTLTTQVNQISGYSADALDRLRQRSPEACLADVNARLAVENVLFDTDKAIIKPESNQTLDDVAEILQSCEGASFEIAGHTDFRESDAYNIDLSQRRVAAVRLALAERGVDVTGYVARGYGEREPIATNTTAEGMRLNRRVEFRPISNESTGHAEYSQCDDSFNLARNLNMTANDSGVSAQGDFTQDQHSCITDRREVLEGSVSYVDTETGQTQSAINLSYRREQYRGSESVFGYFVGLYGSRSEVTTLANGEIDGFGLNAGIYGAKRLEHDLFLDYYLGAAAGRHSFDLAFTRDFGVVNANGDYTYLAGFAGAAISGEFALGKAVVAPRVGFDYIYAPGADVDVIAELGGLTEAGGLELDAISGGRVFAEIRTDYLIQDGRANLWFNPRVSCYQSLGALDGVCGVGGAIGIESAGDNTALTYAVELDGEWGESYTMGSLSMSVAREMEVGVLSAQADMTTRGAFGLGAAYDVKF